MMRSQLAVASALLSFVNFVTSGELVEYVDPSKIEEIPESLKDDKQGIKMGVVNPKCDDGKKNLDVDYDGSPVQYTCYTPKQTYPPQGKPAHSRMKCDRIDKSYFPQHYCMNQRIIYDNILPTYEGHRPLWAMFGEYTYLPCQRWLHNVEHGAVVMLYHPCTQPQLVEKLRSLVVGCLRKYVITPYKELSPERPLALIAWTCRYEMSGVDEQEVITFIKTKALKGPEAHYPKEGQYSFLLKKQSSAPEGSDENDSVICPNM